MRKLEKDVKKKGLTKILAVSFTVTMAVMVVLQNVLPVSAKPGSGSAYDQSNPSYHYFYKQLNDESKRFYETMEEMYKSGIFAEGGDYDLSKNGKVTDEQLESFVNGSSKLIDDYGAARDAFQYDYPDVFYVDFSLLTVRVVRDSNGTLHGYLGSGRSDSYLLRTFTKSNIPSAVEKYEDTINKILRDLPSQADGGETLAETQTIYIHDYLTKNMIYHYENEVSNKDCNSRTAYDALIYGEGVCEAYTRGFKALMDRAGIPTVCVYGVYKPTETTNEMHIWNYVQIDGKWYGVDVTQDDPVVKGKNDKNSNKETRKYCLVGELDLAQHHIPSGVMSTANYEFKYPKLEMEALREVSVYADGDLVVKLFEDTYSEDSDEILQSGTILVSYRGKNYTQNASEGYYILSKFGQYYPESDEWNYSGWGYITPQYYDVGGEGMEPEKADETMVPKGASGSEYGPGYYVRFPLPHIMKAQFAVTTIPPTFKYENGKISGSLYYEGDLTRLSVISEEIENEWGTYVAPPYPEKVSPAMDQSMVIGKTYHIKAVYNDDLKDDGTGAGVGIKISQSGSSSNGALTGQDYSKVENVKWDNARTVEFDFTPSQQYADNNSYYSLQITGLVGVKSGKKPVPVTYGCRYVSSYCALGYGGFNWKIFGQPQLLDVSDIDTSNWEGYDMTTGEKKSDLDILASLTNRLTLVTQEPSPGKTKEMTDVLESQFSDETFLTEKTYNIQLTLCSCMIVKTGESLRVCVGFPAGYDYSSLDRGVTYKAYHYKVDPKTNQLTGEVEEIRCFVTEYGLIIECDSFSPFTIAAVKSKQNETPGKTLVFQSGANGSFYDDEKKQEGKEGSIEITSEGNGGAAKKITIKANAGYFISAVIINNKRITLDENTTEYTIRLDDNEEDVIVLAEFMSLKVQNKDVKNDNDTSSKSVSSSSSRNSNSDKTDSSVQTDSDSDETDSSVQTDSDSDETDSSVQTDSGPESGDSRARSATAPNSTGSQQSQVLAEDNNAIEKKSGGQVQSKQQNPLGEQTIDDQAAGYSYASGEGNVESENIDSEDESDAIGVFDSADEYEDMEIDETKVENTFLLIIIGVVSAGIVAVGIFIVVLLKRR